eukprot:SAG31_NODE_6252_length_2102_cov_1.295057_2_plen_182_part_00
MRPADHQEGEAERPPADEGPKPTEHAWSLYHRIVIACCYAALLAGEASECSLDVALPNAQVDPTTVLGPVTTPRLLALGVSSYGIGKIFVGGVCDLLGGPGSIATAMTMMAAGLRLVGASGLSFTSIAVPWAVCRMGAAASRPAVYLNMKPWFVGNGLGAALGIVSTAGRVGAIIANAAVR